MIGVRVRSRFNGRHVRRRVRSANITNLAHAGAALRLIARRSIRRSPSPSPVGSPPHTRRGQIKRAILYKLEKADQRVVIGPAQETLGDSAMAHEFGGRFRGERYRARPFMGPALQTIRPRLPAFWQNSVK